MTTAYEALLAKIHGIITARDVGRRRASRRRSGGSRRPKRSGFSAEATIGAERFPPFADPDDVVARLVRDISSVGSELDEWIAHPDVEEIWGIDGELWARMTTGEVVAVPTPASPLAVRNQIERFVAAAGEAAGRLAPAGGRGAGVAAGRPPRAAVGVDPARGWTGRSISRSGFPRSVTPRSRIWCCTTR